MAKPKTHTGAVSTNKGRVKVKLHLSDDHLRWIVNLREIYDASTGARIPRCHGNAKRLELTSIIPIKGVENA